jgi:hypothetical protein
VALASLLLGIALALRWQQPLCAVAGVILAWPHRRPDRSSARAGSVLELDGRGTVRIHGARGSRLRRLAGLERGAGHVALRFADAQAPARLVLRDDALPAGAARRLRALARLADPAVTATPPGPRGRPRPARPRRLRRAIAPPEPAREAPQGIVAKPASVLGGVRRAGTRIVSRATGRGSG